MPTATAIITDALSELGQITVGVIPNPDKLAFGLRSLNRLIENQFNLLRGMLFTIRRDAYVLFQPVPSPTALGDVAHYQIGPTVDPTKGFVAPRPLGTGPGNGIKNANIILTDGSPPTRVPLYLLDDDQWADIRLQQIQTTIPVGLYNDGAFPNSNLYLWGQPTQNNLLELFTRQQIDTFGNLADEIDYPPGYDEALVCTLAEHMAGPMRIAMPPDLPRRARVARANLVSTNTVPPLLSNDAANIMSHPQRSTFNWRTGGLS